MANKRIFTPDQEEQIRKLAGDGLNDKEIAEVLGSRQESISAVRNRLGIAGKKPITSTPEMTSIRQQKAQADAANAVLTAEMKRLKLDKERGKLVPVDVLHGILDHIGETIGNWARNFQSRYPDNTQEIHTLKNTLGQIEEIIEKAKKNHRV